VYATGILYIINILYVCKIAFNEWIRRRQLKAIRDTKIKLAILQRGMNKLSSKKAAADGKSLKGVVFSAPVEDEVTPDVDPTRKESDTEEIAKLTNLLDELEGKLPESSYQSPKKKAPMNRPRSRTQKIGLTPKPMPTIREEDENNDDELARTRQM